MAVSAPLFRPFVDQRTNSTYNPVPRLTGYRGVQSVQYELPWVVHVTGLPVSSVHVKEPFFVRVEVEGDKFYASSPIGLVYELGDTQIDALRNYLDALAEHFEFLSEEEAVLSPLFKKNSPFFAVIWSWRREIGMGHVNRT